jgi:hypothetical protein
VAINDINGGEGGGREGGGERVWEEEGEGEWEEEGEGEWERDGGRLEKVHRKGQRC